jgi:hypothetical protein
LTRGNPKGVWWRRRLAGLMSLERRREREIERESERDRECENERKRERKKERERERERKRKRNKRKRERTKVKNREKEVDIRGERRKKEEEKRIKTDDKCSSNEEYAMPRLTIQSPRGGEGNIKQKVKEMRRKKIIITNAVET